MASMADDVVADAARRGGGTGVRLSTSAGALCAGAIGKDDAAQLTANRRRYVDNTVMYAPRYSTDGYAVLAVNDHRLEYDNLFPANFASDGARVSWSFRRMRRLSCCHARHARRRHHRHSLTGPPAVPPPLPSASSPRGGAGRTARPSTDAARLPRRRLSHRRHDQRLWRFTNVSDHPFLAAGQIVMPNWCNSDVPGAGRAAGELPEGPAHPHGWHPQAPSALPDEAHTKGFLLPGGELRTPAATTSGTPSSGHQLPLPAARGWYATHRRCPDVASASSGTRGRDRLLHLPRLEPRAGADARERRPDAPLLLHQPRVVRNGASARCGRATSIDVGRPRDHAGHAQVDPRRCAVRRVRHRQLHRRDDGAARRWMQLGAFMPTCACLDTRDATSHFSGPAVPVMKAALEMRYQLLPYLLARPPHVQ